MRWDGVMVSRLWEGGVAKADCGFVVRETKNWGKTHVSKAYELAHGR